MKKFILPTLVILAAVPAAAHAEETTRFEHEGRAYSYTVTKVGDHRVIRGVEERSGKPFTLRVGTRKVRGTVGSQHVQFSLKEVEPLAEASATIASR